MQELDNKYIEAFLLIYLLKNGHFLELEIRKDNLDYLLADDLTYINKKYGKYFYIYIDKDEIKIDIKDFNNILNLDIDILKSISLLSGFGGESIFGYIDLNFSKAFVNKILPFFKFIEQEEGFLRKNIVEYVNSISNFKLKNILLFLYYGVGNDSETNINKSIQYLNAIIDLYPNFVSFYLLRMRQKFNLVYKIKIGVYNFNKLIITDKGKQYIYNNEIIKSCFYDLEKAEKLIKSPNSFLLFKGKFLLHLLDSNGLLYLFKYLKNKKILFNENVFSWFGVYYLQIGQLKLAKRYLELVNYSSSDRYKAYSKLLFLYVKGNYKSYFYTLFNEGKFKNILILLYDRGVYYNFNGNGFSILENIDDSYNHKDKMGFKINNFNEILIGNYLDKNDLLKVVYNNISRNYYDHWSSELEQKLVFYSYDNFTFGYGFTNNHD